MTDNVGIANLALIKLGNATIADLDDTSEAARATNAIFEMVRDAELEAHPWNFSIKRAELAASATVPDFEYDLQYPLPADFLRLYEIYDYPTQFPTEPSPFAIENGGDDGLCLLTNWTAPVQIRYVAKVTNPALYNPLFVQALSCSLALALCDRLTQHQGKKEQIGQEYEMWLAKARRIDAIQNPPIPMLESAWLLERL